MVAELAQELSDRPMEIREDDLHYDRVKGVLGVKAVSHLHLTGRRTKLDDEREEYEEANFVRVNLSKKDKVV